MAFKEEKSASYYSILKLLMLKGNISRKDIADLTGLTPAAITLTTKQMIDEGIIIETGKATNGQVGRKKRILSINYDYQFVVGAHIDKHCAYLSVYKINGECIAKDKMKACGENEMPAEEFFRQLAKKTLAMLKKAHIPHSKIFGMGLSTVGLIDSENKVNLYAAGMWSKPVYMSKVLEPLLPFPLFVENNVIALAVADIIFGLGKNTDDVAYVKWMPGLGAACVLDGRLLKSRYHEFADIGEMAVPYAGGICSAGSRNRIEDLISMDTLVGLVKGRFSMQETPKLYEALKGDAERICEQNFSEWIVSGDSDLDHEIESRIYSFAITIANFLTVVAPQKVVMVGQGFSECGTYLRMIQNTVLKNCQFLTEQDLLIKDYREQDYFGGAAIAINMMFGPQHV